ncbi:dTDP-4-dehydrorhamnose reductase [Aestuariivirga sp.]|uniref:dTDP-4-dehydrorhamnose reductase n=1 Tax=Aestuariivirga sp. TaxID=2650926 RepID=UPI003BAAF843
MKLLVFGKTGQVARELARAPLAGDEAMFLGRSEADLRDAAACAAIVNNSDADAVINAAAFTAVDRAETEEAEAFRINADAAGAIARACAARAIPLLHLSTDYVFDGAGSDAFSPDHPRAPLNAYGRSKCRGEDAVRESGARHLILRTSWIFSVHGHNFLKTMLRLGRKHAVLRIVSDQLGGPTPAPAIAAALLAAAKAMCGGHAGGTHHFSGTPDVSWAAFARAIMDEAGFSCRIEDIASADYPVAARRPLNSRLDCSSLEQAFGIARPGWRDALHDMLQELETGN